jgi:Icc-related predicted phosphoesterase
VLIGFVGDVHGSVFLAIAALATWQRQLGRRFDLVIQCGDLGAFPDLDRLDPASRRYLAADPSQADFRRLLGATGPQAALLRSLRACFDTPIYFVRGNHDDRAWLRRLPLDPASGTAVADSFDFFRFVPDSSVLTFDGVRIAFLGGSEEDDPGEGGLDRAAFQVLADGGQDVDVLATHDAPYGISVGYYGQVQGSRLITELEERLHPSVHVTGHYGLTGPFARGGTTFLCLNHLVALPLWQPDVRGLQVGCLASLDTASGDLAPVDAPWLATLDRSFDFDAWGVAFLGETA